MLNNVVEISRLFMELSVKAGDAVIDATCGNGQDTLALSRLVGDCGRVYAFDRQLKAIENTKALLLANGRENVRLFAASHEKMEEYVKEPVALVVFNLGYLPGGDKALVTKPETTLPAVQSAARLLRGGGLLLICAYLGHPGGQEEFDCLQNALESWSGKAYNVLEMKHRNRRADAPRVLVVEKLR
mgnify:CR=1 FL=1